MAPYAYTLLRSQLFVSIPVPTESFTGQTVIVTGSNTGLGLEAARHLLNLDAAKVILAVRTVSKGETAAQDLITSCYVPSTRVEVWQLDMSSRDSVKAFAKRASGLQRLDAAILNAGVLSSKWSTIDGVEHHVAVNVIGTVLLELLLLPTLRRSAQRTASKGRIAIIGSDLMYTADPTILGTDGKILDKLNTRDAIPIGAYYALSKLLVFYAHRYIASSLSPLSPEQSSVVLTLATPGACTSEIFRDEMPLAQKVFMSVMLKLMARTTEVGGRTLVHAVSPSMGTEEHGKFLMDCEVATDGYGVESEIGQKMEKHWNEELFAHLESIAPGCTKL
ncbi:hypothetical protein B0A48_09579 [Cryoendolithus antarcticus]|uniref:Ketoreductase (KR) domain-containing protein n=1 Tax=Cryoendolithus antarcticus TaxID=1507870 RepID=A0A1V8SZS0_9PEZI|nr:hypothetical protein B0A48_09579 [Cryoendolithus antarcticus]